MSDRRRRTLQIEANDPSFGEEGEATWARFASCSRRWQWKFVPSTSSTN